MISYNFAHWTWNLPTGCYDRRSGPLGRVRALNVTSQSSRNHGPGTGEHASSDLGVPGIQPIWLRERTRVCRKATSVLGSSYFDVPCFHSMGRAMCSSKAFCLRTQPKLKEVAPGMEDHTPCATLLGACSCRIRAPLANVPIRDNRKKSLLRWRLIFTV